MTSDADTNKSKKPISSRTLAELARSGFSVLRDRSKQVAFEVHHVSDRPGYLRDVLEGKLFEGDAAPPFIETLTTAAHGVGLVIGTYEVGNIFDDHGRSVGGERPELKDHPDGHFRVFRGRVTPNVNFVYDSARLFEGLIEIESKPTILQLRHGQAIRNVARRIAHVAVEIAGAPILSLQSPVQLPLGNLEDTGAHPDYTDLPSSSALAVRFAIALNQPNAEQRLKMAKDVMRFCAEQDYGLWLADTRPGFRAGNWFRVLSRKANSTNAADAESNSDTQVVRTSLPITMVGPARIGSTKALLDYLAHYPDLGILACSMTAMDDMAFIHLQLCGDGVSDAEIDTLNRRLDAEWSEDDPPNLPHRISPPSLLPRILPLLVRKPLKDIGMEKLALLTERAGDYKMLVGPAQELTPKVMGGRKALWVAWEVEGSKTELKVPFIALHKALHALGLFPSAEQATRRDSGPNIEYLICRQVRGSVLRGKGKLSVRPESFEESDLTTLIVSIESAWRGQLPSESRVRELTVSWREFWLGHWTNPLE